MAETQVQDRADANDNPSRGRIFGQEVVTVADRGLRKRGNVIEPQDSVQFEIFCDEGTNLGGENSAPKPITYFLWSVGFCALTQLHRYGEMMKVEMTSAKVTVKSKFKTEGSVLKETVRASAVDFEIAFDVESDAPPDRVAACIRNAEAGCFVMQCVVQPTPIKRAVTLNGKTLAL